MKKEKANGYDSLDSKQKKIYKVIVKKTLPRCLLPLYYQHKIKGIINLFSRSSVEACNLSFNCK